MATSFFFNNQQISIPGAYSVIRSGISNPALSLAFGNTLIIDKGLGAGFGGGSGINGTLRSGKDSIYTFDNIRDFQNFVGGGSYWFLSQALFQPAPGESGISSLTYIRATTTSAAASTFTFTGGGANGGNVVFETRTEGNAGNGVEVDATLATVDATVTNAGAANDTIILSVNGSAIGTYTSTGGTVAEAAAELAVSINELGRFTGYSATVNAAVITISSPIYNPVSTETVAVAVTGTATATAGALSGGVVGTIHTRGYAALMRAGTVDSNRFVIEFYRGGFRGLDGDIAINSDAPIDGVAEAASQRTRLTQSPEFDNIQELIDWATDDFTFNQFFNLRSSAVVGDGSVDAADLVSNAGNNLFSGATESYSTTDLDEVLENITDLNFDFILASDSNENAQSSDNLKLLAFITNESRIKPDLYIGGGNDASEFSAANGSIPIAQFYDSEFVTIQHGGVRLSSQTGQGFKEYNSIYHASLSLGREAGLAPQVPLDFKNVGVTGLIHQLKDSEVEQGLDGGVLMTRFSDNSFEVVKGVNSEQRNDFLVNEDGSTPVKSIRRIVRQINKELTFNLKNSLLKNPIGPNRNTLSTEDVETFVRGYLKGITATSTADDLILSFQNVSIRVEQDAYFVEYEFVPNFPVSFIFSVGFIIDPSN